MVILESLVVSDTNIPNLPMDSTNPSLENSPSKTMATSSSTDASYFSAQSHLDSDGQKDSAVTVVISKSDKRFGNGQRTVSSVTTTHSSEVISHSEKSQSVEKTTIEISANSPPKISVGNDSHSEPRETVTVHKGTEVTLETSAVVESGGLTASRSEQVASSKTEQILPSRQSDSSDSDERVGKGQVRSDDENDRGNTPADKGEITNQVSESVGITT